MNPVRWLLGRLAESPAVPVDALRQQAITTGFLEGFGVSPASVAFGVNIKNESSGEPVRDGAYNRASLSMKDCELLFAFEQLSLVPHGQPIIDIASGSSLLPAYCHALGYEAWQHDMHPQIVRWRNGRIPVECDVLVIHRKAPLGYFACAFLICALEHFGLGRYGDALNPQADIQAVESIWGILKPGGVLVVTVPFGPAGVVWNTHRIYNAHRLALVFSGWALVREEYRAHPVWTVATQKELEDNRLQMEGKRPGKNHGLAMLVYRKT